MNHSALTATTSHHCLQFGHVHAAKATSTTRSTKLLHHVLQTTHTPLHVPKREGVAREALPGRHCRVFRGVGA